MRNTLFNDFLDTNSRRKYDWQMHETTFNLRQILAETIAEKDAFPN